MTHTHRSVSPSLASNTRIRGDRTGVTAALAVILSLPASHSARADAAPPEGAMPGDKATGIATVLLDEFHHHIGALPGSDVARVTFIREGLALLEAMPATNDPDQLLGIAGGYVRMADIMSGVRTAHRGDLEGALALLDKADAIRGEAEAHPGASAARAQLIAARGALVRGQILREQENSAGALAAYRAAIDALGGITGPDATSEQVTVQRAMASLALADQLIRAGDPGKEREGLITAAIEMLRPINGPSASRDVRWALAQAQSNLGEFFVADANDPQRGLEVLDGGGGLWVAVLGENPADTCVRCDLARAEHCRGTALSRLNRLDDAMVAWSEAARHYAFLREADPTDRRAALGMATVHEAVGGSIRRTDPAGAIQQYAEAVRILEPLVQSSPDNLRGARVLGLCQYMIGRTTMELATPDPIAAGASAAAAYHTLERIDLAAPGDEAFTRKRIVDAAQVWLVALDKAQDMFPPELDRDAISALMKATVARWNAEPVPGAGDLRSGSESLRRMQELLGKMVSVDIQPASAAPQPR